MSEKRTIEQLGAELAFPVPTDGQHEPDPGLTKMEYYAGIALGALMAARMPGPPDKIADYAVEYAAALIRRLNP